MHYLRALCPVHSTTLSAKQLSYLLLQRCKTRNGVFNNVQKKE